MARKKVDLGEHHMHLSLHRLNQPHESMTHPQLHTQAHQNPQLGQGADTCMVAHGTPAQLHTTSAQSHTKHTCTIAHKSTATLVLPSRLWKTPFFMACRNDARSQNSCICERRERRAQPGLGTATVDCDVC